MKNKQSPTHAEAAADAARNNAAVAEQALHDYMLAAKEQVKALRLDLKKPEHESKTKAATANS